MKHSLPVGGQERGKIMSGDMQALAELIARVQVGTRVKVVGHGVNEGTRTGVVTRLSDSLYGSGEAGCIHTLDRVIRSQGRTFGTGYITWPVDGDDFKIEGNTLREYTNSVYAGGRCLAVEITFTDPQN